MDRICWAGKSFNFWFLFKNSLTASHFQVKSASDEPIRSDVRMYRKPTFLMFLTPLYCVMLEQNTMKAVDYEFVQENQTKPGQKYAILNGSMHSLQTALYSESFFMIDSSIRICDLLHFTTHRIMKIHSISHIICISS